jgi:hypothetical protein
MTRSGSEGRVTGSKLMTTILWKSANSPVGIFMLSWLSSITSDAVLCCIPSSTAKSDLSRDECLWVLH